MISVGISFCPNDTFSFYHFLQERKNCLTIADLESLNEAALQAKLDIVKISAALYPRVKKEYQLLQSGSALGFQSGPLVIAKKKVDLRNAIVALPGKYTTARFLFDRYQKNRQKQLFVRYDEIIHLLHQQKVDAGVIIHESRFRFEEEGFEIIQNLGKLWEEEFSLPLPLGIIVAKRSLGKDKIEQIENLITHSILSAKQKPKQVWDFVKANAIEKKEEIIQNHIDLYVNEESIRLTDLGKKALDTLWKQTR